MNPKNLPEDACDLVDESIHSIPDWDKAEAILEKVLQKYPNNEDVLDLVIGYGVALRGMASGMGYGYYGLIIYSVQADNYQLAFHYCQHIVRLRPRMAHVLINENRFGIESIVYTAAENKDWGVCRAILDTALEWDPLSKERIGKIYLEYAYLAGLCGELGSYAKAFIHRAESLLGEAKDEDLLGITFDYEHLLRFSVEDYYAGGQYGGGKGYLGLAMLAMRENQLDIAGQFCEKGLEILERNPRLERKVNVWEMARVADMKGMPDIACKFMKVCLKGTKVGAYFIAGEESIRLAKKCGLE